ncbi:hypothetical protein GALMADRAFT_229738 [Galerina marginata CBS 339.88]|uniref:SH3 domain-containing protein n=1 Tax=Galerina marginata (strain CBS 339.88) TaxID=685588 RepID=A0A067SM26_GALM3|nr:hypothetical protein GALMADRAFT_229738 [Galerina marginata CBS 339.88]
MASAVYSEPPASRLSISLEGSASASPFPSPSSSFLPPPTPGAHEFAVKPVPPARNGRKTSLANTSNPHEPGDSVSQTETKTPSQRSSLNVQAAPNGSSHLAPSKDSSVPIPLSPGLISPMTPTPSSIQRQYLEPPPSPGHDQSNSSSTTPTTQTVALPPEDDTPSKTTTEPLSKIYIPDALEAAIGANGPSSPAFSTSSRPLSTSMNTDPSLFSNRPAPPSPASRRVSGAPSISSTRSRSSRPPSTSVSRTNSLRKSTSTSKSARGSPVINPRRQSQSSQLSQNLNQNFASLPSPQNLSFALNTQPSSSMTPAAAAAGGVPTTPVTAQKRVSSVVYIKIRDFGFPPSDERHIGLGSDVPKPNKVGRMNRRLGGRTLSQGSMESSDGDGEEEVDDDEWGNSTLGGGWDGFRMGLGRINWNMGAGNTAASVMEQEEKDEFPSRMDLDMNFLVGDEALEQDEDEDEEYFDAAADEEDEDTLYPGLYRALYAFEPEGIAEMRLEEDQIVRVVGRGGGVGWAVVIDDKGPSSLPEGTDEEGVNGQAAPKHALVPESYLEPVKLDWEDEEAAINSSPAEPETASTET